MQRARVRSSDFGSDGFLSWDYRLTVPQQGPLQIFTTWRAKAVLAWNSRVSEFNLFGIRFLASSLRLDLDLEVYDSGGNLVTGSWSWDNSYEIAEWTAVLARPTPSGRAAGAAQTPAGSGSPGRPYQSSCGHPSTSTW